MLQTLPVQKTISYAKMLWCMLYARGLILKSIEGPNSEWKICLIQCIIWQYLNIFCTLMIKINNFICLKESRAPHKHLLRAACLRPLLFAKHCQDQNKSIWPKDACRLKSVEICLWCCIQKLKKNISAAFSKT